MIKINEKEINMVLQLEGNDRYNYFIKKIADTTEVWGLYNDGWALVGDEDGNSLIPLWPMKEYAEIFCKNQWAQYQPMKMDIYFFLDEGIQSLEDNNIMLAIFFNDQDKGVVPTFSQFRNDVNCELSKIE